MKESIVLKHEFVEFIPEELNEGTIYVSIRFTTASHRCCCGCGQKVVTPITPTDWKLVFDGKTISLDPSIGNWGFSCRSHYWIRNNQVQWAAQWSETISMPEGCPTGLRKSVIFRVRKWRHERRRR